MEQSSGYGLAARFYFRGQAGALISIPKAIGCGAERLSRSF
jgi:hypothetical protein